MLQALNRNAMLMVACQLLFMIGNMMFVTLSPVLGKQLGLAQFSTLPMAVAMLSMLLITMPLSKLMQRKGRFFAFRLALIANLFASLTILAAIYWQQGWLLVVACMPLGINMAAANFYRFAAMELVDSQHQSVAISAIMSVGVIAAVIGPNLASKSQGWISDYNFAATIALFIPLSLLALMLMSRIHWPQVNNNNAQQSKDVRIHWQPLMLPIFSAATAFGVMVMIMSATPLHMENHHFNFDDTAWVIQWHVLGMFAPAFFIPWLSKRIGLKALIQLGAAAIVLSSIINLLVNNFISLTFTLALLGIGWNFMFTASSQMLMRHCNDHTRHRIQAINEIWVFSFAAFATFTSSFWLHYFGWFWLNILALPLPFIAIVWWYISKAKTS